MDKQGKLDQVAGILLRHDVPFNRDDEGAQFVVTFGSSAIFIAVQEALEGLVVSLRSPVVSQVEDSSDATLKALIAVNALNVSNYLVKFVFDGGYVGAEVDLLADALHPEEFIRAMRAMAMMVDGVDDDLAQQLGGKTLRGAAQDAAAGLSDSVVTDT